MPSIYMYLQCMTAVLGKEGERAGGREGGRAGGREGGTEESKIR